MLMKFATRARAFLHAHASLVIALGLSILAAGQYASGDVAGATTSISAAGAALGIKLAAAPAPPPPAGL